MGGRWMKRDWVSCCLRGTRYEGDEGGRTGREEVS